MQEMEGKSAKKAGGADLDYEGRIYVRPIGRGVMLRDLEGEPQLDELIEDAVARRYGAVNGWSGRARIRIEILERLPDDLWDG